MVCSWVRYYATSRKVAGSIPDDVFELFSKLRNLSSLTVGLVSAKPLTEISIKNRPAE
jgi:hypothetical protein